jgi:hypothetical protein
MRRAVVLLTVSSALVGAPAAVGCVQKRTLAMRDARAAATTAARVDAHKTFLYPKGAPTPACTRVTRLRVRCTYTIADDKQQCRRAVLVIATDGSRHLKTRITRYGCEPS